MRSRHNRKSRKSGQRTIGRLAKEAKVNVETIRATRPFATTQVTYPRVAGFRRQCGLGDSLRQAGAPVGIFPRKAQNFAGQNVLVRNFAFEQYHDAE
jgi:hypothetical protein